MTLKEMAEVAYELHVEVARKRGCKPLTFEEFKRQYYAWKRGK